ncbi:MAG: cobalamin biosynthesis protein CbiM [Planctomycetes bacterium RBG_13_63_9]|nr:MAG: cobalamin biosynthesis protein CbiM [Planctomycetes bacterium RBG_13_63_9]
MHIYEGVLAGTTSGQTVLAVGALAAAAGTALGLRKLDYERIPRVAVLSSAFFVISLVHVPIGPTSEHLLLSGLMGLVLGWAAFPAVLVALLLQAVFFGFGGPTALGLNTLVMALPAVVCYYLFRRPMRSNYEPMVFLAGFAAGATAIVLGALLVAVSLWLAGSQFDLFGHVFLAAHLPVALIEGLVTGSVVVLLRKVRPELLEAPLLVPRRQEVLHG